MLTTGNAVGKTWESAANGLWTDAASWDPPGVPQASDDVIIPQAEVTIATTATVNRLTVQGTGFLKVAAQGGTDPAAQTPLDANATNPVRLTVLGDLTLADSGKLAVGGLNQNANATLSVGGDLTLTNSAKLAVYAGPTNETVSIESGGSWVTVAGQTTVGSGCWIYPVCNSYNGAAVVFTLQDLQVVSGGGFDADSRGFGYVDGATLAPGAGLTYMKGGSYGGRGGRNNNTTSMPTYGEPDTPYLPGSPSGIYNGYVAGGGAIRIEARDVVLDGTLTANTVDRSFSAASGGSIWLTCRSLQGDGGSILAEGGTCTAGYNTDGGGGRIALDVANDLAGPEDCAITVSARQGIDGTGRRAEVGSLWIRRFSLLEALFPTILGAQIYCPELTNTTFTLDQLSLPAKTHLMVNTPGVVSVTGSVTIAENALLGFNTLGVVSEGFRAITTNCAEHTVFVGGDLEIAGALALGGEEATVRTLLTVSNNLALTSPGTLFAYAAPTNATTTLRDGGSRVDVIGNLTVGANSWVYPTCHVLYGTPVVFSASNLTVEAEGGFNANERGFGYLDGITLAPGKGYNFNRGGGHGGYGGNHTADYGNIYGTNFAPILPGSPNGTYSTPFRGGGAIQVRVQDQAVLQGALLANGNDTELSNYGGPSGGSIWITAALLTFGEQLKLEAKGGWASSTYNSGGGGGRIALGSGVDDYMDAFYNETLPGEVTIETLGLDGVDVRGVQGGTDGTAVLVSGPTGAKSLTVRGSPAGVGAPTPGYGGHSYAHGSEVTCSAPSPGVDPLFDGRSRLYCGGFVVSNALGEVTNGTANSVTLTLDQNLTLTWLWNNREHRFDAVTGEHGMLEVNSTSVSNFTTWVDVGQPAPTVTAVADSGMNFVAWAGDVPYGMVRSASITPTMDVPRSVNVHFAPPSSTTRTWQGGTGAWFDPAHWDPAGIPTAGDHIAMASGVCTLSNYAAVASMSLSGNAILRVGGVPGSSAAVPDQLAITSLAMGETGLDVAGNLELSSQAQLGLGGVDSDYNSFLRIGGDLTLADTARLAIFAGPTNQWSSFETGGAQVTVAGEAHVATNCWIYPVCHQFYGAPVRFDLASLIVAAGGGFDAVQRGYGMRVTGIHPDETVLTLAPGKGYSYSRGGGYGGYGGSYNDTYGQPYGSPYAPFRPGSPSGYYYRTGTFPHCYGLGGGALNLHCERAVIHGILRADGGTHPFYPYGGSSGGGIWLTTLSTRLTLGPTAVLSADGGPSNYNSKGGGGRIAIGIGLSPEQVSQAYQDETLPKSSDAWSPQEITDVFPGVTFSVDTPIVEGNNSTPGTVAVYKSRAKGILLILR